MCSKRKKKMIMMKAEFYVYKTHRRWQRTNNLADDNMEEEERISNNNNYADCPKPELLPLLSFKWPLEQTDELHWKRKPAALKPEQTMRSRKPIRRPLLAATILILIAYELSARLVVDYHRHIYKASTCPRCLPELIFIKPCSAAVATTTTTTTTTTATFNETMMSPNDERVATILSANTTTTLSTQLQQQQQQQQLEHNYYTTTSPDLPSNQTAQAANLTTQIDARATANVRPAMGGKLAQSGGDFTERTAQQQQQQQTNKQHYHLNHLHLQQAIPTVLCNSRCNCVILEPLIIANVSHQFAQSASSVQQQQQQQANRSLWETELWRGGGTPNQVNHSAPVRGGGGSVDTAAASAGCSTLANNGSFGNDRKQWQQQQQLRAEQALIAFNEDYSLDYEHSPASSSIGSGGGDDPGALDVEPAALSNGTTTQQQQQQQQQLPTSGGNSDQRTTTTTNTTTTRITNSTPPDNVQVGGTNIPMMVAERRIVANQNYSSAKQATQMGATNGNSKLSTKGSDESEAATATTTTNPSDALAVPGSSRQAQLQQPEAPRNATPPSTAAAAATTTTTTPSTATIVNGGGANETGKTLPAQAAKVAPSQQPGMTLFSLPNHLHNHLRGGHHHLHQHQPLGAGSGRDANGPQMYAQSLYSSQAPKLSFHAHTPYLKSQPGNSASSAISQQQQQQQQSADQTQAAYSFQNGYSHLRSTYLGHHLRQLNPIYTQTNIYVPQQRVLVALKTLDLSAKLKWKQQTLLSSSSANENDENARETNWHNSPELINSVEAMLITIDQDNIQSLVLRDNEMQFELWSELYALLAVQMRQHLFHIDLSHNALSKLGITFTGYIEHHLAAHGSWPFNSTQSSGGGASNQSTPDSGNEINAPKQQSSKFGSGRTNNQRSRHSLLSGGKLYALVQQQLANRQLLLQNQTGSLWQRKQVAGGNLSHVSQLQQPLLVRALDLSHNKLKWLINDQFRALKHVQTIRLDHNRIRYVHQHAFSGLESLRFLNLNFNRLQVIYIEQFQTNYNLLALMLRSNYLTYLRGGSFASLANLKRLDLSGNKLTVLSNNAFIGLESLELLNCSSNLFVHAPSASMHPLISLKRLDLSDNLISQLAPGTFFHLPLEELFLNQNEQLTSIDRGAFWDLPYLQRLHLKSNPMLSSINSQAFVGTQSLQTINVQECQLLDGPTKQMLENVTMTATSRLLRQEQSISQPQQQVELSANISENQTASVSPDQSGKALVFSEKPQIAQEIHQNNKGQSHATTTSSRHFMDQQVPLESTSRLQTCIYYLGTIALLVVALKLVFKFTSTGHYMEARRRRRRVFEVGKGTDEVVDFDTEDSRSMSHCSASDVFPMCVQPVGHMLNSSLNLQTRLSFEQQKQQQQQQQQVDAPGSSNPAELSESQDQPDATGYDILYDETARQSSSSGEEGLVENRISCSNDTNDVISGEMAVCCPDCSGSDPLDDEQQQQQQQEASRVPSTCCELGQQTRTHLSGGEPNLTGNQPTPTTTIDLIHSQLIAAGFDYGHAHCAHFYQSLGPALQFADITANIVSNMDYY